MLSVDQALNYIREAVSQLSAETIPIEAAAGRVLATEARARLTQSPFAASAMDGYAVRFEDTRTEGACLKLIGEARPGGAPPLRVGPGEGVRIFTGGIVPSGADHILVQEEARREGDLVTVTAAQTQASYIRPVGMDFCRGDVLRPKGARLSAIDLSLLAAGNIASVSVIRRPLVALFDNGDELVELGSEPEKGRIVASNRYALVALIEAWGGRAQYLGRADDTISSVREMIERGHGADIVVSVGGASVGEHDHARAAFAAAGGSMLFEKVAVRPGKPSWFGRLGDGCVLGLPGNPASAIVCAVLFLRPLIAVLLGADDVSQTVRAALDGPLPANGQREAYLRAQMRIDTEGRLHVRAASNQDSSLISVLAEADTLIRRPAGAPAAPVGAIVEAVLLSRFI